MQVLYVRVSDTAHAYLSALSAESGLPMAKITDMVICEARARGWQITTSGARITDTRKTPAGRSPASTPRDKAPPASPPPRLGAGPQLDPGGNLT